VRGVTIRRPWANLVARGSKRVENRTWRPPAKSIGRRIAIHAGLGIDRAPCELFHVAPGPGGVVVAVAVVDRVVDRVADVPVDDRVWYTGPLGWLLRDVVALPAPVPCRGALGLWRVPEAVEAAIFEQLSDGF